MNKWGFEFPREFKFNSYNGEKGIWILDVPIENIKKCQLSYKVLAFPRRTKFKFVAFKSSSISLPPNTPQQTMGNHVPNYPISWR